MLFAGNQDNEHIKVHGSVFLDSTVDVSNATAGLWFAGGNIPFSALLPYYIRGWSINNIKGHLLNEDLTLEVINLLKSQLEEQCNTLAFQRLLSNSNILSTQFNAEISFYIES